MAKEFVMMAKCDRCGKSQFFRKEDQSGLEEWGTENHRGAELVLCPSCLHVLNKLLDSYMEGINSGTLVYTSDGTPVTLSMKEECEL